MPPFLCSSRPHGSFLLSEHAAAPSRAITLHPSPRALPSSADDLSSHPAQEPLEALQANDDLRRYTSDTVPHNRLPELELELIRACFHLRHTASNSHCTNCTTAQHRHDDSASLLTAAPVSVVQTNRYFALRDPHCHDLRSTQNPPPPLGETGRLCHYPASCILPLEHGPRAQTPATSVYDLHTSCIRATAAYPIPHTTALCPCARAAALYLHDKPHKQRPLQGGHAPKSGDMKTDTSSSPSHPHSQIGASITPLLASHRHVSAPSEVHGRFQHASLPSKCPTPPPASSTAPTSTATTIYSDDIPAGPPLKSRPSQRRSTLPFSFPFFQLSNNTSVTSLVPSTAEGKPIPFDDGTAAHRTSALRELNSNFPSPVARHHYTKSSGAQSSTYSQPVIVRTYSGPTGSRGHSRSNSHSARRPGPLSTTSTSISYVSPVAHSRPPSTRQNGGLVNMGREKPSMKMPWPWKQGQEQERPTDRLPPYEAFSFKTIMANMQAQSTEVDKALDGIAEIYARSRYSLSNQYEVHVAPHGSGASLVGSVPSFSMRRIGHPRDSHSQSGPTLQAIQSDDDDNSASARAQRRRRYTGRRRSAAHSTLETIMSSSRSSEEDKTKKKSASELVDQARGRAASKSGRSGSGSPSTNTKGKAAHRDEEASRKTTRKRPKSFANAIIYADTSKTQTVGEAAPPRNPSSALLSEPSLPQTSSSHLEIRTTPNDLFGDASTQGSQPGSPGSSDQTVTHFLQGLAPREEPKASGSGLISGLGNWVPWKSTLSAPSGVNPSEAEGSLRELLKTVDFKDKGKSVERTD